eukprot:1158792-Prymnesium_polylepis.1
MLFSTFRVNVQEVEHLECGMQPLSPDPDEPEVSAGADPAEKRLRRGASKGYANLMVRDTGCTSRRRVLAPIASAP